jgi:hypothetical protein
MNDALLVFRPSRDPAWLRLFPDRGLPPQPGLCYWAVPNRLQLLEAAGPGLRVVHPATAGQATFGVWEDGEGYCVCHPADVPAFVAPDTHNLLFLRHPPNNPARLPLLFEDRANSQRFVFRPLADAGISAELPMSTDTLQAFLGLPRSAATTLGPFAGRFFAQGGDTNRGFLGPFDLAHRPVSLDAPVSGWMNPLIIRLSAAGNEVATSALSKEVDAGVIFRAMAAGDGLLFAEPIVGTEADCRVVFLNEYASRFLTGRPASAAETLLWLSTGCAARSWSWATARRGFAIAGPPHPAPVRTRLGWPTTGARIGRTSAPARMCRRKGG